LWISVLCPRMSLLARTSPLCGSSIEFCIHNPLCSFLPGVYCCLCWVKFFGCLMAYLKEYHICFTFCSKFMKNVSEMHEMLTHLWVTLPRGEYFWVVLSTQGYRNLQAYTFCPSTGSICEKWRKFKKSSTETNIVPFHRSPDRLGILYEIWKMQADYKGGLKCVVDLHEVCSLIAYQQPEVGHEFACQELLDKSEATRTPSWRS
jgi:hypothetical protein